MSKELAYPRSGSRIRVRLKPYRLDWMNRYPEPPLEGIVQATRDKTILILTHTKNGFSPGIEWSRIASIEYLDESGGITDHAAVSPHNDSLDEEISQSWEVQGSKGKIYTVSRRQDQWSCTCVAGSFGKACKHVQAKREELSV